MAVIITVSVETARHTPVTSFVVGKQVVMVRASTFDSAFATTDSSGISVLDISVRLLYIMAVTGIVESLRDKSALQCDVLCIA